MFCKNCGNEVDNNAVVCPHCGVQLKQPEAEKPATSGEMCTLAIVGFILSFFISIAGLICSIIGYKKCKNENLKGSGFAIAGIIISALSMVLYVVYIIVAAGLIAAAAMA